MKILIGTLMFIGSAMGWIGDSAHAGTDGQVLQCDDTADFDLDGIPNWSDEDDDNDGINDADDEDDDNDGTSDEADDDDDNDGVKDEMDCQEE